MNGSRGRWGAVLVTAVIVLFSGSCEDNEVLAPKDTSILLSASPSRVVIEAGSAVKVCSVSRETECEQSVDCPGGETCVVNTVPVALTAKLLSVNGFPQTGISVVFSADAGTLASGGQPIVTDSKSQATDVLEVPVNAPNKITVAVRSGSVSQTLELTKTTAGLAPTDGTLGVSANPASLEINANRGETSATSQIAAQAFDKNGSPLTDILVWFRTTAGTLAHSLPVPTDANGIALTELTLSVDQPDEATVTATSSSLYSTVKVTKTFIPLRVNKAPNAVITAVPLNTAFAGNLVIFDGTGSSDEDGQIVSYRWTVASDSECCSASPPAGCQPCESEQVPDPADPTGDPATAFGFSRIYLNAPQNLVVTLEVTDDKGATDVRFISYRIDCANPAPVVSVPDQTQNAQTSGQTVSVILDGSNTTDDKTITPPSADHYRWDCGNGTVATPLVTGDYRKVICRYTAVAGTANEWIATLTVYDNGSTGDLVNGIYPCQKSTTDTAKVKLILP